MNNLEPNLLEMNTKIQKIISECACYCREMHFTQSDHAEGFDTRLLFDPTEPSCTIVTCSILRDIVPRRKWLISLQNQYKFFSAAASATLADAAAETGPESDSDSDSGPIWF